MISSSEITVFIVEDQEILRYALQHAIAAESQFKIVGASSDGLTAVHQVSALKPDIVLMDLSLPTINGIEATRLLKESDSKIKVIALTGRDDRESVLEALHAGATGYCLKDAPFKKIVSAIQAVWNGALYLDEKVSESLLQGIDLLKREFSKSAISEATGLSSREQAVVKCIADGLRNKEIAKHLQISISTVRTHISNIAEKMSVSTRTEIALKAHRHGLVR